MFVFCNPLLKYTLMLHHCMERQEGGAKLEVVKCMGCYVLCAYVVTGCCRQLACVL